MSKVLGVVFLFTFLDSKLFGRGNLTSKLKLPSSNFESFRGTLLSPKLRNTVF